MLLSESMIMTLARKHLRGVWIGLAITTISICSVIFVIPRPLTGMSLNIAIGVIIIATIAAGIATYSLTRLALLEVDFHKRREADDKEKAGKASALQDFDALPPQTTEEDDIVLWDDPTTEETETEEVITESSGVPFKYELPPASFFHKGLLAAACTLAFFLNLTLIYWYIEDAAISFAYAKHFAAGEGLVTYLGGERVEGYSNPLWTLLLAIGYLIGVDGFTTSKALGLFFNVITVPLVYEITRHLRPHKQDATPIIAAFLLAGNAQFAIWGAAGLENSLFNFLLALGVWRVLS